MQMWMTLVLVVQLLSALTMIGLVLVQHGKGADMGAAFGSGASGSLFGATGSSNFMSKSTGIAAAIFFSATLALSFMASERSTEVGGGVMERVTAPVAPPAPVSGSAASPGTSAPVAPAQAAKPATPAPATPAGNIPK